MDFAANVILVLMLGFFHQKIFESPIYGLAFWLLFLVCHDILHYEPGMKLGLNIVQLDIIFVYFSYVSFLRYSMVKKCFDQDGLLKLFLISLIFIIFSIPLFAIVKGQPVVGSINLSRSFLLFLPAFTYFFSFNYDKELIRKILNLHIVVAVALGAITLGLQLSASDRVLASHGSLFFAFVAALTLCEYYREGNSKYLLLSLLQIGLVIISRHRSVWIVLCMSLLFIHIYANVGSKVLQILAVAVIAVLLFSVFLPSKFEKISEALDESASPFKSSDDFENSSGGGRVARWAAQIESKFEPMVLVWGLGHGYDRRVYFRIAGGHLRLSTVSFHNHYLEQTFRIGLISVIILIAFAIKFFRLNHIRQKSSRDFYLIGLASCLFGCLAFGMTYSFDYQIYILLGIGYSILTRKNEYSSNYTHI